MTQPGVDPLTAYVNISNIFLRSQGVRLSDLFYLQKHYIYVY
jgi:hypothetical protein